MFKILTSLIHARSTVHQMGLRG
uniref:Uncharacterized protein n=1 Tax=Rhizophora mucronata TaxID=61149 RepID=A0A2P2P662_RHIMU